MTTPAQHTALPERLRYIIEPGGNPAGKITSDSPGQFEDLESAKAIAAELVRRYNAHTELVSMLNSMINSYPCECELLRGEGCDRCKACKLLAKFTGQTQV